MAMIGPIEVQIKMDTKSLDRFMKARAKFSKEVDLFAKSLRVEEKKKKNKKPRWWPFGK